MRFSLLISSAAFAALLLSGGSAAAQTDSTNQQLKPELDALPPDEPQLLPGGNPKQQRQGMVPEAAPGTFQPARPTQPTGAPVPARRPVPEDAGSPVIVTPPREKSKWFVTGNPDLGFRGNSGYSVFNIGLSALFGYRITDRFAIGPGLTYQHTSFKGPGFSGSYANVGGRIFGQALITENIFAHAEIEALRTAPIDPLNGFLDLSRRITVNSQFAGLGYRQHMG